MRAASISAVAFGAVICETRFIDPRKPVNGTKEKWHQNAAIIEKSSLAGSPLFAIPEPIGVKVVYSPNCCSRYLMIYKAQRDCVCMLPWQINKILTISEFSLTYCHANLYFQWLPLASFFDYRTNLHVLAHIYATILRPIGVRFWVFGVSVAYEFGQLTSRFHPFSS